MSEKIWSDDAWEDYPYWQMQDKRHESETEPAGTISYRSGLAPLEKCM